MHLLFGQFSDLNLFNYYIKPTLTKLNLTHITVIVGLENSFPHLLILQLTDDCEA